MRQEHDEDPAGLHLHRLAEPRLAAVEREHVLGEHRRQRQDLRVARHDGRHDPGAEQPGQPERREPLQHDRDHVVARSLAAERGALGGRHRGGGAGKRLARAASLAAIGGA